MNNFLRKTLAISLGTLLITVVSACANEDSESSNRVFQNALDGIGGRDRLNGLAGFRFETSGIFNADDEGYEPDVPYLNANEFVETVSNDLLNARFHTSTRLILHFEALDGVTLNYQEVIHTNAGSRSNGSTTFDDGSADYYAVDSSYLGAIQRQNMLVNPHLFLLQGLANPEGISTNGTAIIDGQAYDLLVIEDSIQDVTLYVNSDSGEIKRLATMEVGNFRRDVPVRIEYSNWTETDDLSFPLSVSLYFDGFLVREATRSNLVVNPSFDATLFDLPDIETGSFSADAIAAGAMNRQLTITFRQIGIPPGFIFRRAPVEESELATGVYRLGGGATSSLVIEQSDHVVLLEAPLHEERALSIIDWINGKFIDKPIKYVVPTHHHQDHAAGVRTIMAEGGVTLVVASAALDFWKDTILSASSTIEPDALELNPIFGDPEIIGIAAGTNVTLGDDHPVIIHRIANGHAEDMVIASITTGTDRIVFEGDLYNLGTDTLVAGGPGDFITRLQELGFIDSITCQVANGTTLTITATHGAAISEPVATTIPFLLGQGQDIPCQIP